MRYLLLFPLLCFSFFAKAQNGIYPSYVVPNNNDSLPIGSLDRSFVNYSLELQGWKGEAPLHVGGNGVYISDTSFAVFEIEINQAGEITLLNYKEGNLTTDQKILCVNGIHRLTFLPENGKKSKGPVKYSGLIRIKKRTERY